MKRCLSLLLALSLIIACAPVIPLQVDASMVTSGACGNNLTWSYDNYVLTISGTGAMDDYKSISDAPWSSLKDYISYVVIDNGVTTIGDWAFSNCLALSTVTIPEGITSIGAYAFYNCPYLRNVTIPEGVTTIGDWAFALCFRLTDITIPDSVISFGNYTFSRCSCLTSVTIGNGVVRIGDNAFDDCTALTSITIGSSVTSIGQFAFKNCKSIKEITIPGNVINIGPQVFYNCTGLTSVTLSDNLISMGANTFYGCTALTSITIPSSVTSIDYSSFQNCTSLKEVHITDLAAWCAIDFGNRWANPIFYTGNLYLNGEPVTHIVVPDNVSMIGDYAFAGLKSLVSVTIPYGVGSIGIGAFRDCDRLIRVRMPDSVTAINADAFLNCSGLTKIVLPGNITDIGYNAFQGCTNLKSITVPESVTRVIWGVFKECTGLTTVYYRGTQAQKDAIVIDDENDYLVNAEWKCVGDAVAVLTQDEAETYYETLKEAVAADSGIVTLITDCVVDTVVLKPGVTLDLDGCTLEARLVVGMKDANILDSYGLLKVNKDNLALDTAGQVVPVWNGTDGYVFTKVLFQQMAKTAGEGAAQYIFLPAFSNAEAAALMVDGGADNGLKIKVSLNWGNGQSQQFYTYSDELVQKVFDGTGSLAFDLSVTGIAGIEDMTAQAVVVTDTGAQATNVSIPIVAS